MLLIANTMFTSKQYHERQRLKTVAFGKLLVAFDFDEILSQINYAISRVKRFSLHAFCGWLCALNFKNIIWKTKNALSAKILS